MKLGRFGEIDFGFLTFLYKKILNTRLFLAVGVLALFAFCFMEVETTLITIAGLNSTAVIDSELKNSMVDLAKSAGTALIMVVGFFFMSKASEGGAKATKASEEIEEDETAPALTSAGSVSSPASTEATSTSGTATQEATASNAPSSTEEAKTT